MNARELGQRCPLCREEAVGGRCACVVPLRFVVLQIDEWTPEEALANVQLALQRAANALCDPRYVN